MPKKPFYCINYMGTNHAPTATTGGPGGRLVPHGIHKNPRGQATLLWWPHEAQGTGQDPPAATRGPVTGHAPRGHTRPSRPATIHRRPHETQGADHASTAATRLQSDRPRPHGGHKKPRDRPHPHCGHTKPRGPATPPRQPHDSQGTGHAKSRGPATPPRLPHEAQGTGLDPMAATRVPWDRPRPTAATHGPGDRPRPHGSHTRPRGPTTPHGGHSRPRGLATPAIGHTRLRGAATHPRRPHETQGTINILTRTVNTQTGYEY